MVVVHSVIVDTIDVASFDFCLKCRFHTSTIRLFEIDLL